MACSLPLLSVSVGAAAATGLRLHGGAKLGLKGLAASAETRHPGHFACAAAGELTSTLLCRDERAASLSRRSLLLTSVLASTVMWTDDVCATVADDIQPFARATDEFDIQLSADSPLGLRLRDLKIGTSLAERGGSSRVVIADVASGGQADALGSVEIDQILVAVNGQNVERESAQTVQAILKKLSGKVQLTLKDALRFNEMLEDPLPRGIEVLVTSTALTPSNADEPAQVLSVTRRDVPVPCSRPASDGDLLEIAYEGRIAETGALFDGMDLAKRQGDSTLQFVLGKQPVGQFPPAWDVALVGMCVGERRTIDVPPVLGYGAKGLPKRGVPPNARLQYDVQLIAINANTAP